MSGLLDLQNLPITQQQFELAYQWLIKQRQHYPANADIWFFKRDWTDNKEKLLRDICSGNYVFSALKRIYKQNGQVINLWCSQDSLVLKLLSQLLSDELNLSTSCKHVKGHGGLKQSVADVQSKIKDYHFVCKTDVKSYYESIDQYVLIEQIHQQIENKILRRYLYQVVHRSVEYGGNYQDINKGISRGCSLSPILGALYLKELDDLFSPQSNVYYVRYMDDILIMTKTRWQNRKAIKQLNQCFSELKVEQHPDKTFIGRLEKGFYFLGYHFSRKPLRLADITVWKHVERIRRLYEQQISKGATSDEVALVLGGYVKRWLGWCAAGLGDVSFSLVCGELHQNREILTP